MPAPRSQSRYAASPARSDRPISCRIRSRKRIPARSIAWQRIEDAAMPSASWCAYTSTYSCLRICSATVPAAVSSDMVSLDDYAENTYLDSRISVFSGL